MDKSHRRYWAVLIPAMILPFLASLVYFVIFDGNLAARLLYVAIKVFIVAWPLVSIWLIFGETLPRPTIDRRRRLNAVAVGVSIGIAIAAGIIAMMYTPLGRLIESGTANITAKADQFAMMQYYWPFALALSLVNSLVEEYYWRWFLFGRLQKLVKSHWAHILAGLAFAAHHTVITTVFFGPAIGLPLGAAVGLGGIIWSIMYQKQNTIIGAWASHLIVDLGIFLTGHKLLFGSYL